MRLAAEDPAAFVRVAASMMPKNLALQVNPYAEMTDQEIQKRIDALLLSINAK